MSTTHHIDIQYHGYVFNPENLYLMTDHVNDHLIDEPYVVVIYHHDSPYCKGENENENGVYHLCLDHSG